MFKWNWQVVTVFQRAEEAEEEEPDVHDITSDHPIGFAHNAMEDDE
jgi:hypothetical protein